jgi:hypothetical protein
MGHASHFLPHLARPLTKLIRDQILFSIQAACVRIEIFGAKAGGAG